MTFRSERLQRGEVVRVRGERWRVAHVTSHEGCAIADLAGCEASNAGQTGRFILPFEPLDRFPLPVDRLRVVRASTWRHLARARLAEATGAPWSLRAAAQANVVLLPYQLEPALAITRGLACRLLLADEVGLGKTIQAGFAIAEVLAREREARVLIVTPASLREQWRDELHDRFSLDALVIDAAVLARASSDLPPEINPWSISRVAITSIDYLKRADVIRALESLVWDLVAFDEAHALCGRSDRAVAADLVASRARRVLIITATPHSGDDGAFERLRALGRVGASDALLTFRRSRIEAGFPRTRVVRHLRVSLTEEESRMHRALRAYAQRVSGDAPAESAAAARLAMIVLGRRASSSAASLARSIERRIALLDRAPDPTRSQLRLRFSDTDVSEDDEPLDELAAPGLPDRSEEERMLRQIVDLARAVAVESKIETLRRLLARTNEPVLVFTEYRDTLAQIVSALGPSTPLRAGASILHGGLSAAERAQEARRFTHGDAQLLVATDAASEGLNLHQRCRLVVNLDVPWTPLRLEQRIGRVDRLGQQRRVHAITFVARETSEEHVASTLKIRSGRAERDAPFSASSEADASLYALARLEATRLENARRLASRRRTTVDASDVPIVSMVKGGRLRTTAAVRLLFVDSSGAVVWDTVKGFAFDTKRPAGPEFSAIRHWFHRVLNERAVPLAASFAAAHESALAIVRDDLRAATAALLQRERDILDSLRRRQARLAAPLLQPGLFDRRAIREAGAQQRVAEDAAAAAGDRIRTLERQWDIHLGERTLVFVITLR